MFKDVFKYYKSKNPEPDLSNVMDIHNKSTDLLRKCKIKEGKAEDTLGTLGLKPSNRWEIFEILEKPGLIYIRNPFTGLGQRYWTVKCLRDYPKAISKRNIDTLFNDFPEINEWDFAKIDQDILKRLRWATLGYHHNWDTKIYAEENKGVFPDDLRSLIQTVAQGLGYFKFLPQAAIINYYHMNSTLSGHTDHSEQNLEAPLFSLSFGQSAIFLLGGQSNEETPLALFLKSGDIIVMSKESRLSYHGIPKIVKAEKVSWNGTESDTSFLKYTEDYTLCQSEGKWMPFGLYLNNSRININVRQVLNLGQNELKKEYE